MKLSLKLLLLLLCSAQNSFGMKESKKFNINDLTLAQRTTYENNRNRFLFNSQDSDDCSYLPIIFSYALPNDNWDIEDIIKTLNTFRLVHRAWNKIITDTRFGLRNLILRSALSYNLSNRFPNRFSTLIKIELFVLIQNKSGSESLMIPSEWLKYKQILKKPSNLRLDPKTKSFVVTGDEDSLTLAKLNIKEMLKGVSAGILTLNPSAQKKLILAANLQTNKALVVESPTLQDCSKEDLANDVGIEYSVKKHWLKQFLSNAEPPSTVVFVNSDPVEPVIDITSRETEEKKKFACSIGDCGKSYTKKHGLKNHLDNDHADITAYLCEYKTCTQNDTSEEFILKHSITKHKKVLGEAGLLRLTARLKDILGDKSNDVSWLSKRHFCKDCNKHYSRAQSLNNHTKSKHTGSYRCIAEGCDKQYATQSNLNSHIKTVHGDAFACTVKGCNKRYSSQRYLGNHIKTEHEGRFVCIAEGCDKHYSSNRSLNEHTKAKHGDGFACTEYDCNKRYSSQRYLDNHIKTEHEDRFVCPKKGCRKRCSNQSSLNNHLKAYHGNGFACPIDGCDKHYSRKSNLNNHIKNKH